MLRSALLVLALLATPADYTECKLIHNGPLLVPRPGFGRQPDNAAVSGFGTVNDDDWPPMRFRKVGTTTVTFAEQAGIDRLCGKAQFPFVMEACANDARIVLPDPCTFRKTDDYARLACHENSHRFGQWPEDHPQ